MFFQTKSQTLHQLTDKLRNAHILPQFAITQSEWEHDKDRCLDNFALFSWSEQPLIVRSSYSSEDSKESSFAGHFSSYQNISGREELMKAIGQVMTKYGGNSKKNAVFIQPMLKNVILSGVAFTRIPPSGAPYYLINYDNTSGRTDTVTSGGTNSLRTFYCHRSAKPQHSTFWSPIILFLKELEYICQNDALDVEFAMTLNKSIFLFQVRPLLIRSQKCSDPDIDALAKKIKMANKAHPHLLGKKRIYGIMPDWNPAELIGTRPKPLAFSLFKELISNDVWALSRFQYGYRDVRGTPLILNIGGQPYVDVRASFNSFIPRQLDQLISKKLVDYYLELLRINPNLHDKVEFGVVISCFTFDLPVKLDHLQGAIPHFDQSDVTLFRASLINLTNRITHFKKGLWRSSLAKLSILQNKYERTLLGSEESQINKIRFLIQDCKKYGTFPFAGLARSAFIAIQILKSLIAEGIFDSDTCNQFLQTIRTISCEMTDDLHSIDREAFLNKYGHLRPGTFDIISQRYDEAPDLYFDFSKQKRMMICKAPSLLLTSKQRNKINNLLIRNHLHHSVDSLFEFISEAIKAREYGKFMFTKNLSAVLKLIEEFGKQHGLSREECSFLEILDILCSNQGKEAKEILKSLVERGKESYVATSRLHLPPVIFEEKDVHFFHLFEEEPTFVTLRRIRAQKAEIKDRDLRGKIIFIESADPGYDWIFSRQIAGFVTCYGGANSHMTVRAAELNLPAVIGSGQTLYRKWIQHSFLDIDCSNRKVIGIK